MSQTIFGAEIAVQVDFGAAPIILGRDILDATALLTPADDALEDVTATVLALDSQWGARDPRGILTDVEAGRATISLLDPARDYDPGNDSTTKVLVAGANGRYLVDGAPAFTGYVDTIEHSTAEGVTTIVLQDAIPRLSNAAAALTLESASTADQLAAVLDSIGWPADKRITYGSPAAFRDADPIVLSGWLAVNRVRDAELGDLWVDRAGRVAFRTRADPVSTTPVATVGDAPGIPLLDILSQLRRASIVNHVAVDMTDPTPDRQWADQGSMGLNGRKSHANTQDVLRLVEPF